MKVRELLAALEEVDLDADVVLVGDEPAADSFQVYRARFVGTYNDRLVLSDVEDLPEHWRGVDRLPAEEPETND